jgi:hypothetical protein
MGRWAQRRHRGGGGAVLPSLPAPVLSVVGDTELQWSWTDPDPDHWQINTSTTADGPWDFLDVVSGAVRNYDMDDLGLFMSIIGLDIDDNPVTSRSNSVHF